MEAYMNIPWKADATGPDGCSCWGLVQLYYQGEYGIVLPPARQIDTIRSDFRQVSVARRGDILLFRDGANRRHAAVALDGMDMLHVSECNAFSCIERYRGFSWKHRLLAIYRHLTQV